MKPSGRSYTDAEVRTIAYMAAGASMGVVMKTQPRLVMPAEEICEAIERLLVGVGAPCPAYEVGAAVNTCRHCGRLPQDHR